MPTSQTPQGQEAGSHGWEQAIATGLIQLICRPDWHRQLSPDWSFWKLGPSGGSRSQVDSGRAGTSTVKGKLGFSPYSLPAVSERTACLRLLCTRRSASFPSASWSMSIEKCWFFTLREEKKHLAGLNLLPRSTEITAWSALLLKQLTLNCIFTLALEAKACGAAAQVTRRN